MVIRKIIDKVPVKSSFAKLILGTILVALLVSLGAVGVLVLFGVTVEPVIPSSLAAFSAALYAVRAKREVKKGD